MLSRKKSAAAIAAAAGLIAVTGYAGSAVAGDDDDGKARVFNVRLIGYEEVPAISTAAMGSFRARINAAEDRITYRLRYTALQGTVTQSHIHFGDTHTVGGISTFLCSNLGNGPAGTQACPPGPATVTGTLTAADVIGPAGQGIAAGEFAELVDAIQAGIAYTNVHSSLFPGGEIRGQLDHHDHD